MNEPEVEEPMTHLVLEFALDASPQQVWRAISIPEFREMWLPEKDLVDGEPISSEPGEEICYRLKDKAPPYLDSTVTFRLVPDANGCTVLRITHVLTDEKMTQQPRAANNNGTCHMRAA